MDEDAFFRQLAEEMNCDELPPGTVVEYTDPMLKARGLWVVRTRLDDDRYTLAHPDNEWERVNADRPDLKRAEKES